MVSFDILGLTGDPMGEENPITPCGLLPRTKVISGHAENKKLEDELKTSRNDHQRDVLDWWMRILFLGDDLKRRCWQCFWQCFEKACPFFWDPEVDRHQKG